MLKCHGWLPCGKPGAHLLGFKCEHGRWHVLSELVPLQKKPNHLLAVYTPQLALLHSLDFSDVDRKPCHWFGCIDVIPLLIEAGEEAFEEGCGDMGVDDI